MNIGQELEYLHQDSPTLMFPSLITKLCRREKVECPGDCWIQTEKPHHPLKVKGEGGALKSKKRKIESTLG